MTSNRFAATVITFFVIFLISIPVAIHILFYSAGWHNLDFKVTSVTGEITDDVAHIKIKGTVRKLLTDSKVYDDESYLTGPCEGGEPKMYNIEVRSDSFKINHAVHRFTVYADIDLIKEYGKDYNTNDVQDYINDYIMQMWLCATDSDKARYKYDDENRSNFAVLYMEDFDWLKVKWK